MNTDQNRSFEKVASRALLSTGSDIEVTESIDLCRKRIADAEVDLAILAFDQNDENFSREVDSLLAQKHGVPVVIVSEKRNKEHLTSLFSHDELRNLIARNDHIQEEEVIVTVEKLLRKDIFGMEKYFTWGVDIKTFDIRNSADKESIVQAVSQFAEQLRCDKRYTRHAEVVADEMIMNALYDAPVDAHGKSRYAHLSRTKPISLPENEKAVLSVGSDGRYLGISCKDPFGQLKGETVVQYLKKCFTQDENQIDSKAGGAGVGFYMIFQFISQLVINIDEGKCTEIIGLIDIRPLYRESKRRTKSLNIFINRK